MCIPGQEVCTLQHTVDTSAEQWQFVGIQLRYGYYADPAEPGNGNWSSWKDCDRFVIFSTASAPFSLN